MSNKTAVLCPQWFKSMQEEYIVLIKNQTWDLVPRPNNANIVSGKCLFRHKFGADGKLSRYKCRWWHEFAITDLVQLHYFLSISVKWHGSGIHLCQEQYALDIIQRARMSNSNLCKTLVDTSPKLPAASSSTVADPTEYRSLAGAL
ncbi:hypothetical protein V2J09_021104 [Rumex salicifolius]